MTAISDELGSDESAEVTPQLPSERNGASVSRGARTNKENFSSTPNAVGAFGHGSSIASIPEGDGDPDYNGDAESDLTNLPACPEESDHETEAEASAARHDDHEPRSPTIKPADEGANQMLHDGTSPVANTRTSIRGTIRNAREGGWAKPVPLRLRSPEIRPSTGASAGQSCKPDRLIKTMDVDKGGLCITPTPPTPSVPRLNLEQVRQPQQWPHLDESTHLPQSLITLATFPRGDRGSLEDELLMEHQYEQERDLATEEARHALRDGAGIGSPRFRQLQSTTSPVVASMRGRYTIPYRQVGCQTHGPCGQNLYHAVRPLHGSRRDNDAEAMSPEDPWASSWRTNGQSIGKSPRSTMLPQTGPERYREEISSQFAEGLSATLHVKPLTSPDEEKDHSTMPTPPRSVNPYRRKRAASMPVSTILKPILPVEGIEAARNSSDSCDGLMISPRFDNISANGQAMGQVVKTQPSYVTAAKSPVGLAAHNFSRYGSSGFASGGRRQLPHESACRQMSSRVVSCSGVELDKKAWRKPSQYTGRMVTTTPRHQGPWLGAHATHVHRRPRPQAWNWKTLVPAEEVEIGPGRYEHARWPMQPGGGSTYVQSSIGGGYMSRRQLLS